MKKSIIIAVIAMLIAAFFIFDVQRFLTLEYLQSSQQAFNGFYQTNPVLVIALFFVMYVAVAALSLPGAAVMTILAGALFGLWLGVLLVSFASTLGASLAFLVSRYLLRDTIQQRFATQWNTIDEGVKKDGNVYLFTLRLIPVVPFFVINLLMGLTSMKVLTFAWVSQIGMLAGTFVYVNAGTQLAQLDSLQGIVSPMMLFSFALLALFPWLARLALSIYKSHQVYAPWTKPAQFDRNLIVIGAGAGGLVSAYIAAAVKAKVTLIEAHKMGGDCLNFGCVPSKALIKSAAVAHQARQAAHYGVELDSPRFNFRRVMQRIHEVIAAIEPHDSVERYTQLGVEVLQGHAQLIDPWTVEIKFNDGSMQRLTTRSIIIASGAAPVVPNLPGLEEVGYVTSDTLWARFSERDEVPKRLVVLGGGPIGTELSQAFARLGAEVTLVERNAQILAREDQDVADYAIQALSQEGVTILSEHTALRCEFKGNEKCLIVEHNGQESILVFDELLCALGRAPRLSGYGLETLGIETDRKVVTDEYLATLYPNIYAAGDVVGRYQFTHVAAHQAWFAVVNALFGSLKRFKVDYRVIPQVTYIDPEVARVGMNEREANAQGVKYEVTRYGIDDLDRAITDSRAEGFVKVLTAQGSDRIIGVTIVGQHAGELLAEFVLAMKQGLGLNKILGTIHAYPTMAEANKYAAGEWKRAHAPQMLLRWVQRYHDWMRG